MMAGRASFSSSSSFSYGWKYDVFLSFRGQDTRFGFTANLYKALHNKGIHTFFDDDELQRGDEITPSLLNAIEESRIAIPIFSHNYASSSFCLDELVNIIHCVKAKGRLVLPVFYDVDPSHVRHQRGSYGEALAKHVERFFKYDKEKLKDNMERLNNWNMALKQAANLSGEHFKPGNEYEHEFIGKIVKVVSNKINRAPLHVGDYPVGLESRVLQVNCLLDVGSDDVVHMVGIHGIGGIGKTTLARAVYNLIADSFHGSCFLGSVRENSMKHGLVHLQEMLLSKIVGEKDIKLGDVCEGISIIKHRLHRKKVLLILDDVDKLEQLQAMVRGSNWFGPGSRVIITTRDKHLLASHGVERTYEVDGLNKREATNLLIWKAFKSDKVLDPSHMDILNLAVAYTSGLPLALEVIGSNLFEKSIEEWKSALDMYERIPNKDIQKILKVSFDALEEYQQSIFLDIACCFKGFELAKVEHILCAHHGICPKFGIGVLVEKSLIKIDGYHRMTLHDLIEDMGKEIVRQESKEPGKRSRLWFPKDIVQVLERNTGTSDIEIINLDDFYKFEEEFEVNWDGEAFKKMENLKTLIVRNGRFSEGPKHLPNSLRVLEWSEYPSESLPSDFHPKKLVVLEMSKSRLRSHGLLKVWKMSVNLRVLNFDKCEYITEIPNVSGVPNLEEITFQDCENLIKIHESIGFLDKLRILSAHSCSKLRSFPPIKSTSLEVLELSKCSSPENFHESTGFLDKLRILNVWGCSKLRSFPPLKLTSFKNFDLVVCSSLESFPEILGKMENLTQLDVSAIPIKELPFSIQNIVERECLLFTSLQILHELTTCLMPNIGLMNVRACDMLGSSKQDEGEEQLSLMVPCLRFAGYKVSDEFIPKILAWFPNLNYLDLFDCDFTILPACFKEFRFMTNLDLQKCKLLREVRGIPPNIKKLHVTDCPLLKKSLTLACISMLLNEELHEEGGNKVFHLNGHRIPMLFEHRSMELPISFWFRSKEQPLSPLSFWSPVLSLYVVVEPVQKDNHILKNMVFPPFCPMLIVNGRKDLSKGQSYSPPIHVGDNIYIFDQKQIKFEDNEWNHVVFTLEVSKDLVIKQSGIHVFRPSSMEDICFTNPLLLNEEHRSDTWDSQRQFMQQQKKLALLESHMGQGREWLSLLPPLASKSLNDNVNWDSNLMVSNRISSTPSVRGC